MNETTNIEYKTMEENKSIKSNLLNFNAVEEKIITIRNTQVIIDSDVATLYGVQTKEINQAVKNNPDKFPEGYLIEVDNKEFVNLRSKILTANMTKTRVLPKAFTEKGLYMLATILKSPAATKTTIAIVEAFAKIRELSHIINELHDSVDDKVKHTVKRKSE